MSIKKDSPDSRASSNWEAYPNAENLSLQTILKYVDANVNIFEESDEKQKYSVSAEDQTYLDAVNRGDMETAQRMVEQEARRKGYSSPCYVKQPEEKRGYLNIVDICPKIVYIILEVRLMTVSESDADPTINYMASFFIYK